MKTAGASNRRSVPFFRQGIAAGSWILLLWSAAAGAGLSGKLAWFAEIPANFPALVAAAIGAGLLGVSLTCGRWLRMAGGLLAFLAFAGWFLTGPDRDPPRTISGPEIKVLTWNAAAGSIDPSEATREIFRMNPDVVAFTELTPEFRDAMNPLLGSRYPYCLESAQKGFTGLGVYSRFPLSGWERHPEDSLHQASCRLEIPRWGNCGIVLLHPSVPVRDGFEMRAVSLAAATRKIEAINGPVIVLGDFNASWMSSDLREFCRVNSLALASFQKPTWNANYPWIFRTAIDHVLVSRGSFVSLKAETGSNACGGDHLPVMVTLQTGLPAPEMAETREGSAAVAAHSKKVKIF